MEFKNFENYPMYISHFNNIIKLKKPVRDHREVKNKRNLWIKTEGHVSNVVTFGRTELLGNKVDGDSIICAYNRDPIFGDDGADFLRLFQDRLAKVHQAILTELDEYIEPDKVIPKDFLQQVYERYWSED